VESGLEATIQKYTDQLTKDPRSRAFVPLSDAYRQLGRYEEAIAIASKGVGYHPTFVSGKIALARAYFENGDVDLAHSLLEDILDTSPDNLLANRIFAEVCAQKNLIPQALRSLKLVLEFEPSDARAKKMIERLQNRTATTAAPPPVHTETLANLYKAQGHSEQGQKVQLEVWLKRIQERRRSL